jgi:hypothetical protein
VLLAVGLTASHQQPLSKLKLVVHLQQKQDETSAR